MNTRLIVCDRCTDDMNFQQSLLVIPPDPPSLMNTNPENYAVDETDWLTTQDGNVLTTEDGDPLITDIPNPAQNADLTNLTASLVSSDGSVAVMYLDLFDGDPADEGASVLLAITGSATRTNIASNLTTDDGVATNTQPIIVALASASTTNVSHVGFFSAATGGTLLMSGAVSATYPLIVEGAAVQFNSLGLSIIATPEMELAWGADLLAWDDLLLAWGTDT